MFSPCDTQFAWDVQTFASKSKLPPTAIDMHHTLLILPFLLEGLNMQGVLWARRVRFTLNKFATCKQDAGIVCAGFSKRGTVGRQR